MSMRQIQISSLTAGQILDGSLYSPGGKLLLGQGRELTADMLAALENHGMTHGLVGEWDGEAFTPDASSIPMRAYREEAERLGDLLEFAMVQSLAATQLNLEPTGSAFEESVSQSIQEKRPQTQLHEWESICSDGENLVEAVMEGDINVEDVGEAVEATVHRLMEAFRTDQSLLAAMTNMKGKNVYLYRHALNVAVLSISIGSAMGYSSEQIFDVALCALTADIGMTMVSEKLINKPRRLSPAELVDVQRHTIHSLYALQRMPGLPISCSFVAYQCHERADGSGYPQRRPKFLIHRYAQIVSVADVYDALTSHRPWRRALHPYRAMEFLIRQTNMGKFDSAVVRGLLRYLSLYPIGTVVNLSTGDIARVIHSNPDAYDRPVVSILSNGGDSRNGDKTTLNLLDHDDIRVTSFAKGSFNRTPLMGF